MEINLGDIVWAKVTGFPEWPGIVTSIEDQKATVHFIGDRTHIVSDIEKLKPFESFIPKSINSNRWLKKSYQCAKKQKAPVSMESYNKFNEELLVELEMPKKREREPEIQNPKERLESKILNLHRVLDQKIISSIKNTDSEQNPKKVYPSLIKKSQILNSFTVMSICPKNLKKYSTDDIIKSFGKMLNVTLSQKLFNSSKIIKCFKIFKSFLELNTDSDVKHLVRISDKMLRYWNKLILFSDFMNTNEDELHLRHRRNQVYQLLSKLLEEKGIPILSCRSAAVKIEKTFRKLDPDMGANYMNKYLEVVEDIKNHEKLTLQEIFENYYENN